MPETAAAPRPAAARRPAPPPGADTCGTVFEIKRCSFSDGPGIRTVVFFKGCPLRCLWCHNPESQEFAPEMSFNPEQCATCGVCMGVCPQHCHQVECGVRHDFDRADCTRCEACGRACPYGALTVIGRRTTAAEIAAEVLKDRDYYAASGGGLTLSGGEPLAQPAFAAAILALVSQAGVSTCVETAGHVAFSAFERVLGVADLFLFDYKETDPALHRRYTGVDNRRILENLAALDAAGQPIILRCPVIPGLNDRTDHFAAIAALSRRHPSIREIHLMPYHAFADYKSARIGKDYPLPEIPTARPDEKAAWKAALTGAACPVRVE